MEDKPIAYITKSTVRKAFNLLLFFITLSVIQGIYDANGFYNMVKFVIDILFGIAEFTCITFFLLILLIYLPDKKTNEN